MDEGESGKEKGKVKGNGDKAQKEGREIRVNDIDVISENAEKGMQEEDADDYNNDCKSEGVHTLAKWLRVVGVLRRRHSARAGMLPTDVR